MEVKTFDNFQPVKGAGKALALFEELAAGPDWYMLLCYGGVGNGKTHLCEALANKLGCCVVQWMTLIRQFKQAMHGEYKDGYDFLFNNIQKGRRLILDDVGMGGTGSAWEWGELEEIINYRYEHGLLTVVTTNLDIRSDERNEKMPFIPPRIVSRFSDALTSRKVLNSASDYRPLKGDKSAIL